MPTARKTEWRLDDPILEFPAADGLLLPWTIRDACEGTQIFGATGSGKTTGSGRFLALHMLAAGFGGLVLTVKPGDAAEWERYAGLTGRQLIRVSPDTGRRFNFLDAEYQESRARGRPATQSLVSLFLAAMEGGQERVSTSDPYWDDALRQLLTNAIDLAEMAKEAIHLGDIVAVIRTAPQSRDQAQSQSWRQNSPFWNEFLVPAERNTKKNRARRVDFDETVRYWGLDFAGLAERTRSVVVSSFTAKATPLLRSPLREMFCSTEPDTVSPADSHRGGVVLLDLPVKEWGEAGRFAQVLFKTVWQHLTERRAETRDGQDASRCPPVFLWADEAQYFVTTHDMLFQQTARSAKAATVYITQNISNYHTALGRGDGRAATESLLGNLNTKIFHATGDPGTMEWAERLIGVSEQDVSSLQYSVRGGPAVTYQPTDKPLVRGRLLSALSTGGGTDGVIKALICRVGDGWTKYFSSGSQQSTQSHFWAQFTRHTPIGGRRV